ncbi:hypothetical protein D9M70_577220 [compost metagenome]
MDHEQVHLLRAQGAQAVLQGLAHGGRLQLVPPDLGGQVDVLAGHPGQAQGLAHGVFVLVGGGGIDMAVTQFQCLDDGAGTFLALHRPGAQAELGHVQSVGGGQRTHGSLLVH